jgi:hypothetical protein
LLANKPELARFPSKSKRLFMTAVRPSGRKVGAALSGREKITFLPAFSAGSFLSRNRRRFAVNFRKEFFPRNPLKLNRFQNAHTFPCVWRQIYLYR